MTEVIFQPSFSDFFQESVKLNDNIILFGATTWEKYASRSLTPEQALKEILTFEVLDEFTNTNILSLDCETYGNNSWNALWFKESHLRLIQVGLPSGKVLICDLGGWLDKENWQSILSHVSFFLEILGKKLFDPKTSILGTNLKFDFLLMRENFGFISQQARDIMIMSQVLWAGLGVEKAKKGEDRSERCTIFHGLKGVASRYGVEVDKTEQTSNWGWRLSNSQLNYAANDVLLPFTLYEFMKVDLKTQGCLYSAFIECQAVSVFTDMEFNGIPICKKTCQSMIERMTKERDSYYNTFLEFFPDCSPTSNPQVLEALQKEFPDLESVDKGSLAKVEHPAAKALVKARALTTDINYVQGCLDYSYDGRIRSFYTQIAASGNGRSSARNKVSKQSGTRGAQLQNPSKNIRDIFVAKEGYLFYDFDGAQMHARIAAELSQSKLLKKIFIEDFDGHSILAGKLAQLALPAWKSQLEKIVDKESQESEKLKSFLKLPWGEQFIADIKGKAEHTHDLPSHVKKTAISFRNVAKTALYSILNGSTAGRLTMAMHSSGYEWFTFDQGKEFLNFFGEQYPELVNYINNSLKAANLLDYDFSDFTNRYGKSLQGKWGCVKTLTGRHIYFKKYPNRFKPEKLEISFTDGTAANWCPVEADIMKAWAVEVMHEAWQHPEWDLTMCNLPHDQGTFHGKEEYQKEIADVIVFKFDEVCKRHIKSLPMIESGDLKDPIKACAKKVLTK